MIDDKEYIPFYGILEKDEDVKMPIKNYEMTQLEVATILGIHKNSVGEIEARALKKLEKIMQDKNIKPEDFFGSMA